MTKDEARVAGICKECLAWSEKRQTCLAINCSDTCPNVRAQRVKAQAQRHKVVPLKVNRKFAGMLCRK